MMTLQHDSSGFLVIVTIPPNLARILMVKSLVLRSDYLFVSRLTAAGGFYTFYRTAETLDIESESRPPFKPLVVVPPPIGPTVVPFWDYL